MSRCGFWSAVGALVVLARPLSAQAVSGTVQVGGEKGDGPAPAAYVVRVSVQPIDFATLVDAICSDDRDAYRASLNYVERTREEVATTRELRSVLDDGLVIERTVDAAEGFRIDSLMPGTYVVWGEGPRGSDLGFQVLATISHNGEPQDVALYHNGRAHVLSAVCSMKQ